MNSFNKSIKAFDNDHNNIIIHQKITKNTKEWNTFLEKENNRNFKFGVNLPQTSHMITAIRPAVSCTTGTRS